VNKRLLETLKSFKIKGIAVKGMGIKEDNGVAVVLGN